MPAGSSLEETNRVITHVEKILRATPEVESTSRRTGLQLGLAAVTEANTGDIAVKLKRNRKRSGEEVIADVRAKVTAGVSGARRGISAAVAGHDRRPHQRAGAGGHQAFLAGSRLAAPVGAAGGRPPSRRFPAWSICSNGIENTISGPARVFNVDPAVAARAGFSPEEVELDASAILQGEPAYGSGGGQRPRLHHPRALPRRDARFARRHPQHPAGQRHRQDGHHRVAGQHRGDSRPDRNPAREPPARRAGDRPLRRA